MSDLVKSITDPDIVRAIAADKAEIERLRGMVDEIHAARAYLREQNRLLAQLAAVTRERDEYHRALQKVAEIECADDLWRAQEMLNQLPAMKGQRT